ncbi:hypothetical protein [Pantoea sp. AS142]|uniref:hypothetical protein n=1 Tax=Pantoea sp. AS142 TaxID=3081292 RepID=UPI00301A5C7F
MLLSALVPEFLRRYRDIRQEIVAENRVQNAFVAGVTPGYARVSGWSRIGWRGRLAPDSSGSRWLSLQLVLLNMATRVIHAI